MKKTSPRVVLSSVAGQIAANQFAAQRHLAGVNADDPLVYLETQPEDEGLQENASDYPPLRLVDSEKPVVEQAQKIVQPHRQGKFRHPRKIMYVRRFAGAIARHFVELVAPSTRKGYVRKEGTFHGRHHVFYEGIRIT